MGCRRAFFDNEELVELRSALDAACRDLNIDSSNMETAPVREYVADLVMRIACNGEIDPRAIQRRAVVQFSS